MPPTSAVTRFLARGIRIIFLTELATDSTEQILAPIIDWLQTAGRSLLPIPSSSTGALHG